MDPARKGISFQYMSDLHLEVGEQYDDFGFPATARFLLLAGDVGRLVDRDALLRFLEKQTARFERVFYLLGNHEFFGSDHTSTIARAKELEKEPALQGKITLLHQTRFDIPASSVTVLGCSLWSQVPDEARDFVVKKVKDYQQIDGWTVDKHNRLHASDIAWLRRQARAIQQESPDRTVVIATHHAPSMRNTSSPVHEKNPWTSAFATDVLSQSPDDWRCVRYWIFGHTHYTNQFEEQGVQVISNQRGYVVPGIHSQPKPKGHEFRPEATIEDLGGDCE
ncbi:Ser/Thr protein phosphatase [Xylariomycetidae sp. FL0641]|nr:Ser/Thr protein phosphatase [Xylariomycetidae sp. FL0641]